MSCGRAQGLEGIFHHLNCVSNRLDHIVKEFSWQAPAQADVRPLQINRRTMRLRGTVTCSMCKGSPPLQLNMLG